MPIAIRVFLLIASIISLWLLLSLILRNLQIFIYVTLPLTIIGTIIRIGKDVLWFFDHIPRSKLLIIFLIIAGLFLMIRLLTKASWVIKKITQWFLAIALTFILLWFLFNKGTIDTIKDRFDNIFQPKQPPTQTGDNNTWNNQPPIPIIWLPCNLPRWSIIPDKYYVYAYKNRKDSPSICDVEIRVCIDGELIGEYEQPYCYQLIDGNAHIIPFDPKNKNEPNPLIQPWPTPYANALFTIHGKRISQKLEPIYIPLPKEQQNPVLEQQNTNTWLQNSSLGQENTNAWLQRTQSDEDCTTPRGETIKNGEFAKAYSAPSLTNGNCIPELRWCNKGRLLGDNIYPSCESTTD